jgi:hypothetical protein
MTMVMLFEVKMRRKRRRRRRHKCPSRRECKIFIQ